MSRVFKIISLLIFLSSIILNGCNNTIDLKNEIEFFPRLSQYDIFKGNPSGMRPGNGFILYELSSTLFTDHAEKQRLIKVPAGSYVTAINDLLPDFPDGTILVKTFFYYNDKRDTSKGKKIIETRLLIKSGASWSAGTYLWNDSQTEASLITSGVDKTMNWIDDKGQGNVISYHVPGKTECTTCHNSNSSIVPIGPKVRNLNIEVFRDNSYQNQLEYLQKEGILNAVNPANFTSLPSYTDKSRSLQDRARAYLDVNCAHCHHEKGFASGTKLFVEYERTLEDSRIKNKKRSIVSRMTRGEMPKLGTTVVDKEGLELIRNFVDSLEQ